MRTTRFVVPGDPVAWQRARTHGKRRFTDPKVAAYKRLVAWAAKTAGALPTAEPVRLDVSAIFARPQRLRRKADPPGLLPMPARPDIDNVAKAILDALNGIAYIDDGQVVALWTSKSYAEIDGSPRVVVEISPLAEKPTGPW